MCSVHCVFTLWYGRNRQLFQAFMVIFTIVLLFFSISQRIAINLSINLKRQTMRKQRRFCEEYKHGIMARWFILCIHTLIFSSLQQEWGLFFFVLLLKSNVFILLYTRMLPKYNCWSFWNFSLLKTWWVIIPVKTMLLDEGGFIGNLMFRKSLSMHHFLFEDMQILWQSLLYNIYHLKWKGFVCNDIAFI